jgi:long-chain-fatty-acid--[acyl-carrier-protein] ligase
VFAATLLAGKVPVMINWTLGDANIEHVLSVSGVKTILTSSLFLDRLDSIDFNRISEHVIQANGRLFVCSQREGFSQTWKW